MAKLEFVLLDESDCICDLSAKPEDYMTPSCSSGPLGEATIPVVADEVSGCVACPVKIFVQLQELLLVLPVVQ